MAIYKNRDTIKDTEKWDLDNLLNKKTVEELSKEVVELVENNLELYKNRYDNVDNFVKYIDHSIVTSKKLNCLTSYFSLKLSENTIDSKISQQEAQLQMQLQPLMVQMSGSDSEDLQHKDLIINFLKDSRLVNERVKYQRLFDKAEHVLEQQQSKLLAKLNGAFENSYEIFDVLTNSEIKYKDALDSKNKKHFVSNQTISNQLENEDRTLRKNVSELATEARLSFKETLTKLLSSHFISNYRFAQIHKYDNHVVSSLDEDNVKPELVETMYKYVKNHIDPYRDYYIALDKVIAKRIKSKDVKPYDRNIKLIKSNKKYSVDDAKKMVLDSVKILGKEYSETLTEAYKNKWVDFHMAPNKRSGAFSAGGWYNEKKYILMNFNETLESVFTLAHESGHSMHTYFNNKNNPIQYADYPIFIAEVASNFCELLLIEHILQTSKDEKTIFQILQQFIDNFNGNVYRQMLFSEFEYENMKAIKNNSPLNTWDSISKVYWDLSKQYCGVPKEYGKYNEKNLLGAIIVPHYYYNFYVYKYAIGMISALNLMTQIKQNKDEGIKNYLTFIKSGSNEWPADILKKVNVDLFDPKTYDLAFDLYQDYVNRFKVLAKKLFK